MSIWPMHLSVLLHGPIDPSNDTLYSTFIEVVLGDLDIMLTLKLIIISRAVCLVLY